MSKQELDDEVCINTDLLENGKKTPDESLAAQPKAFLGCSCSLDITIFAWLISTRALASRTTEREKFGSGRVLFICIWSVAGMTYWVSEIKSEKRGLLNIPFLLWTLLMVYWRHPIAKLHNGLPYTDLPLMFAWSLLILFYYYPKKESFCYILRSHTPKISPQTQPNPRGKFGLNAKC